MADFPSFAGVGVDVKRTPIYSTSHTEDPNSGRSTATSWMTTPRYKFEIAISVLINSELNTLLDFYEQHGGNYDSFTFVDPYDNVERLVRFDDSELRLEQIVPGVWAVPKITMITVF